MPMFEWSRGVLIGSRAVLKVLVWVSIVLSLLLAVYVAVQGGVLWGIVVGVGVIVIAPVLYVLLFLVLSLITLPFRWLLSQQRGHTSSGGPPAVSETGPTRAERPVSRAAEWEAPTSGSWEETIAEMKQEGDVLGLVEYVADGQPEDTQELAVDAIRSLGPPAIPVLIDALPDRDAATVLWCLRDNAIYPVLHLSGAADATPSDQYHALLALSGMSQMYGDARAFYEIERLEREGLSDEVREQAHRAMSHMDRELRDQLAKVSKTVDELATEDPRRLYRTATRLAEWGPSVVPTLLYKAPNRKLRGIAMVLNMLGDPTVVQSTIRAFDAGTPGLAWPLATLGTKFPEALAAVQQAAQCHPDEGIRAEATRALEMRRMM